MKSIDRSSLATITGNLSARIAASLKALPKTISSQLRSGGQTVVRGLIGLLETIVVFVAQGVFYFVLALSPVLVAWVLALSLPAWLHRLLPALKLVNQPSMVVLGWLVARPLEWLFVPCLLVVVGLFVLLVRWWRSRFRTVMDVSDSVGLLAAPLLLTACAWVLVWQSQQPVAARWPSFVLIVMGCGAMILPAVLVWLSLWDQSWGLEQRKKRRQALNLLAFREKCELEEMERQVLAEFEQERLRLAQERAEREQAERKRLEAAEALKTIVARVTDQAVAEVAALIESTFVTDVKPKRKRAAGAGKGRAKATPLVDTAVSRVVEVGKVTEVGLTKVKYYEPDN
jgi:hypothetical protein